VGVSPTRPGSLRSGRVLETRDHLGVKIGLMVMYSPGLTSVHVAVRTTNKPVRVTLHNEEQNVSRQQGE